MIFSSEECLSDMPSSANSPTLTFCCAGFVVDLFVSNTSFFCFLAVVAWISFNGMVAYRL